MAEKGAHLTATSFPKPSIFEVVAQGSLDATIYPALKKIALFLSSCNPKKFGWIADQCSEIYFGLNWLLQYHYIQKFDASFSEHFYGLKRIFVDNNNKVFEKLSDEQRKFCLISLVIVPYLKIKVEEQVFKYRLELSDKDFSTFERKLKCIACIIHATVHICWYIWTIKQYLKYMSGKTDVQTPALNILKLRLTYGDAEQDTFSLWHALFRDGWSFPQLMSGIFSNALSTSIELGAFFMQFIRSWQNDAANKNITALPTPPPPAMDIQAESYRGICPLCMQKWNVPTVVMVSGYIFCFRCIIRHLQEHSYCPVTRYPATMSNIIRVFDD